jgi:hypothetical protein
LFGAGVPTFEHGRPTGALPGRLAKNPRASGRVGNGLRGSVLPGSSEGFRGAAGLLEYAQKLSAQGLGASAISKTNQRVVSRM